MKPSKASMLLLFFIGCLTLLLPNLFTAPARADNWSLPEPVVPVIDADSGFNWTKAEKEILGNNSYSLHEYDHFTGFMGPDGLFHTAWTDDHHIFVGRTDNLQKMEIVSVIDGGEGVHGIYYDYAVSLSKYVLLFSKAEYLEIKAVESIPDVGNYTEDNITYHVRYELTKNIYSTSSPDGVSWEETYAHTRGENDYTLPEAAMADDGSALLTWYSENEDRGIMGEKVSADGTFSEPYLLYATDHRITSTSLEYYKGRYHLFASTSELDTHNHMDSSEEFVLGTMSSADGYSWGKITTLDHRYGSSDHVNAYEDSEGRMILTWCSDRADKGDAVDSRESDKDIWYTILEDGKWIEPTRLTRNSETDLSPMVFQDSSNTFYLAWLNSNNLFITRAKDIPKLDEYYPEFHVDKRAWRDEYDLRSGGKVSFSFTITNEGNLDLEGKVKSEEFFTLNDNGYSLGPGESETFTIELARPEPGNYSSFIEITSNDVDHPFYSIPIDIAINEDRGRYPVPDPPEIKEEEQPYPADFLLMLELTISTFLLIVFVLYFTNRRPPIKKMGKKGKVMVLAVMFTIVLMITMSFTGPVQSAVAESDPHKYLRSAASSGMEDRIIDQKVSNQSVDYKMYARDNVTDGFVEVKNWFHSSYTNSRGTTFEYWDVINYETDIEFPLSMRSMTFYASADEPTPLNVTLQDSKSGAVESHKFDIKTESDRPYVVDLNDSAIVNVSDPEFTVIFSIDTAASGERTNASVRIHTVRGGDSGDSPLAGTHSYRRLIDPYGAYLKDEGEELMKPATNLKIEFNFMVKYIAAFYMAKKQFGPRGGAVPVSMSVMNPFQQALRINTTVSVVGPKGIEKWAFRDVSDFSSGQIKNFSFEYDLGEHPRKGVYMVTAGVFLPEYRVEGQDRLVDIWGDSQEEKEQCSFTVTEKDPLKNVEYVEEFDFASHMDPDSLNVYIINCKDAPRHVQEDKESDFDPDEEVSGEDYGPGEDAWNDIWNDRNLTWEDTDDYGDPAPDTVSAFESEAPDDHVVSMTPDEISALKASFSSAAGDMGTTATFHDIETTEELGRLVDSNLEEVIVVNTHGPMLPIPRSYVSNNTIDPWTALLYHFDEGAGNKAYDRTSIHKMADVKGAEWTVHAAVGPYALSYDGVDDYTALGNKMSPPLPEFSVDLWVKLGQNYTTGRYNILGPDPGEKGYGLSINPSDTTTDDKTNALEFYVDTATGRKSLFVSGLKANVWYRITGTFDGYKQGLYVNETLADEKTVKEDMAYSDDFNLRLGGLGGKEQCLRAFIDDLRVTTTSEPAFIARGNPQDGMNWVRKVAEFISEKSIAWVNTDGYPFYYCANTAYGWPENSFALFQWGYYELLATHFLDDVTCVNTGSDNASITPEFQQIKTAFSSLDIPDQIGAGCVLPSLALDLVIPLYTKAVDKDISHALVPFGSGTVVHMGTFSSDIAAAASTWYIENRLEMVYYIACADAPASLDTDKIEEVKARFEQLQQDTGRLYYPRDVTSTKALNHLFHSEISDAVLVNGHVGSIPIPDQYLYRASFDASTIALFSFDRRFGSVFYDDSKNVHMGQMDGAKPLYEYAMRRQVVTFDGVDDYAVLSTLDDLKQDSFTVEFMLYLGEDAAVTPTKGRSVMGDPMSNRGWSFRFLPGSSGNDLSFCVGDGSGHTSLSRGLDARTWYHVVGQIGAGKMTMYVNGELVGTDSVNYRKSSQTIYIGESPEVSGENTKMGIDDIKFVKGTPDLNEIMKGDIAYKDWFNDLANWIDRGSNCFVNMDGKTLSQVDIPRESTVHHLGFVMNLDRVDLGNDGFKAFLKGHLPEADVYLRPITCEPTAYKTNIDYFTPSAELPATLNSSWVLGRELMTFSMPLYTGTSAGTEYLSHGLLVFGQGWYLHSGGFDPGVITGASAWIEDHEVRMVYYVGGSGATVGQVPADLRTRSREVLNVSSSLSGTTYVTYDIETTRDMELLMKASVHDAVVINTKGEVIDVPDYYLIGSSALEFTAGCKGPTGYIYYTIDSSGYKIKSGDTLVYNLKVDIESPQVMAGVDLIGGSWDLRDSGALDQNGLSAHPAADLTAYAKGTWYHRRIPVPSSGVGQTLESAAISFEADRKGSYRAWFNGIYITNNGEIKHVIYDSGDPRTSSLHHASSYDIYNLRPINMRATEDFYGMEESFLIRNGLNLSATASDRPGKKDGLHFTAFDGDATLYMDLYDVNFKNEIYVNNNYIGSTPETGSGQWSLKSFNVKGEYLNTPGKNTVRIESVSQGSNFDDFHVRSLTLIMDDGRGGIDPGTIFLGDDNPNAKTSRSVELTIGGSSPSGAGKIYTHCSGIDYKNSPLELNGHEYKMRKNGINDIEIEQGHENDPGNNEIKLKTTIEEYKGPNDYYKHSISNNYDDYRVYYVIHASHNGHVALVLSDDSGVLLNDRHTSRGPYSFTLKASSDNKYIRYKILSSTYKVRSGDHLEYDVWFDKGYPHCVGGLDVYSPTGRWSLGKSGAKDQNGLPASVFTDLTSRANGKWYSRRIQFPDGIADEVVKDWVLSFESDAGGHYGMYVKNIRITNNDKLVRYIHRDGMVEGSNKLLEQSGYGQYDISTYNQYSYMKFSNLKYEFKQGDRIEFDIRIDTYSPELRASLDIECDSGWSLRESGVLDQNGITAHPDGNLRDHADGIFYHRVIEIPMSAVGHHTISWSIGLEGDTVGDYSATLADVRVVNKDALVQLVYAGGDPETATVHSQADYSGAKLRKVDATDIRPYAVHFLDDLGAWVRSNGITWVNPGGMPFKYATHFGYEEYWSVGENGLSRFTPPTHMSMNLDARETNYTRGNSLTSVGREIKEYFEGGGIEIPETVNGPPSPGDTYRPFPANTSKVVSVYENDGTYEAPYAIVPMGQGFIVQCYWNSTIAGAVAAYATTHREAISFHTLKYRRGETVKLLVDLENDEDVTMYYSLRARIDYGRSGSLVTTFSERKQIVMEPGESRSLYLYWTTQFHHALGLYTVTVEVYDDNNSDLLGNWDWNNSLGLSFELYADVHVEHVETMAYYGYFETIELKVYVRNNMYMDTRLAMIGSFQDARGTGQPYWSSPQEFTARGSGLTEYTLQWTPSDKNYKGQTFQLGRYEAKVSVSDVASMYVVESGSDDNENRSYHRKNVTVSTYETYLDVVGSMEVILPYGAGDWSLSINGFRGPFIPLNVETARKFVFILPKYDIVLKKNTAPSADPSDYDDVDKCHLVVRYKGQEDEPLYLMSSVKDVSQGSSNRGDTQLYVNLPSDGSDYSVCTATWVAGTKVHIASDPEFTWSSREYYSGNPLAKTVSGGGDVIEVPGSRSVRYRLQLESTMFYKISVRSQHYTGAGVHLKAEVFDINKDQVAGQADLHWDKKSGHWETQGFNIRLKAGEYYLHLYSADDCRGVPYISHVQLEPGLALDIATPGGGGNSFGGKEDGGSESDLPVDSAPLMINLLILGVSGEFFAYVMENVFMPKFMATLGSEDGLNLVFGQYAIFHVDMKKTEWPNGTMKTCDLTLSIKGTIPLGETGFNIFYGVEVQLHWDQYKHMNWSVSLEVGLEIPMIRLFTGAPTSLDVELENGDTIFEMNYEVYLVISLGIKFAETYNADKGKSELSSFVIQVGLGVKAVLSLQFRLKLADLVKELSNKRDGYDNEIEKTTEDEDYKKAQAYEEHQREKEEHEEADEIEMQPMGSTPEEEEPAATKEQIQKYHEDNKKVESLKHKRDQTNNWAGKFNTIYGFINGLGSVSDVIEKILGGLVIKFSLMIGTIFYFSGDVISGKMLLFLEFMFEFDFEIDFIIFEFSMKKYIFWGPTIHLRFGFRFGIDFYTDALVWYNRVGSKWDVDDGWGKWGYFTNSKKPPDDVQKQIVHPGGFNTHFKLAGFKFGFI